MYKFIILSMLSFAAMNSTAVNYPSATTSCTVSDSLATCINAQPANGVVTVIKNGLTLSLGTITINTGFTLQAGTGFHPILRNVIFNINIPIDEKLTIRGFEFEKATLINANVGSGAEINILKNNWTDPDSTNSADEGIRITSNVSLGNVSTVNIKGNNLIGENNSTNVGLIDIFHTNSGVLKINIHDNHLKLNDTNGNTEGIYIYSSSTGTCDTQIIANEIRGAESQIRLFQSNDSASMNIGIVSNLLTGVIDDGMVLDINLNNTAILSDVTNGQFRGVIGNNTIDGVKRSSGSDATGINFSNHLTGATGALNILNNIITNTARGYIGPSTGLTSVTSSGNNVFFNHGTLSGIVLVATDVNAPPEFVLEGINYALESGSIAIDRAGVFITGLTYEVGLMADSPMIDADGLKRFKGGLADAGAYEWGDRHILHTTTNFSSGHVSNPINDTNLNNSADATAIVTQVWKYDGVTGPLNDHPIGIYRSGAKWRIFNEDFNNMPTGSKFHIYHPYGDNGSYGLSKLQAPVAAGTTFEINESLFNGNSTGSVFLTNLWEGVTAIYNPSSLEIGYTNNSKWALGNSDGSTIPGGALFNAVTQDVSRNVFHHIANVNNTAHNVTYIDHPLLNNNPCALPTVSQSTGWFLFPLFAQNPHNLAIFYSTLRQKWSIFNIDGDPIVPPGVFHVLVDPQQVYTCNDIIFKHGFE